MRDRSLEQQARDMMERAGWKDAQSALSSDVVEIANLIRKVSELKGGERSTTIDNERTSTENQLNRKLDALRSAVLDLAAAISRDDFKLVWANLDEAWKEEEDD